MDANHADILQLCKILVLNTLFGTIFCVFAQFCRIFSKFLLNLNICCMSLWCNYLSSTLCPYYLIIMSTVNITNCQYCQLSILSSVNIFNCQYCQLSIFSTVNIFYCQYFILSIFSTANIANCQYCQLSILPTIHIANC